MPIPITPRRSFWATSLTISAATSTVLVAAGKAFAVEADPNPFPLAGFIAIVAHVPVATAPLRAIDDIKSIVARYRAHGVPASLVDAPNNTK